MRTARLTTVNGVLSWLVGRLTARRHHMRTRGSHSYRSDRLTPIVQPEACLGDFDGWRCAGYAGVDPVRVTGAWSCRRDVTSSQVSERFRGAGCFARLRLGPARRRRWQACSCFRGRRPSGSDSELRDRLGVPPQRHQSEVGDQLTRTPLRRACRPQRPSSPLLGHAHRHQPRRTQGTTARRPA